MTKQSLQTQNKIAETLLTTLYQRASETLRPDAMLRDETAVRLIEQIDYDFSRFTLNKLDQVSAILRVRQFDYYAQDFLTRNPLCVVVNLGCGLDTRYERIDNGVVEWYNLDLPEVIEFRHKLIPETGRCMLLGCSIFDQSWVDRVSNHPGKPYLFIAEGVLVYFTEAQVKSLFLLLRDRFPGCELVCDGMTKFMVRIHNLELSRSKVEARLNWALNDGHQPEAWGNDIHLLSEWFYFDRPEPRLGIFQLMRYIPPLAKGVGIFHYRLGNP